MVGVFHLNEKYDLIDTLATSLISLVYACIHILIAISLLYHERWNSGYLVYNGTFIISPAHTFFIFYLKFINWDNCWICTYKKMRVIRWLDLHHLLKGTLATCCLLALSGFIKSDRFRLIYFSLKPHSLFLRNSYGDLRLRASPGHGDV